MARYFVLAIIVVGIVFSGARASRAAFDMHGSDLLEWCSFYAQRGADGGTPAALCSGFIMGTAATLATLSADGRIPPTACPPADISLDGFIFVVLRWLQENPDKHHWLAEVTVASALRAAYPCVDKQA